MRTTIGSLRESIRLTLQEIDSRVNNGGLEVIATRELPDLVDDELELKFADVLSPDDVFGPVPPRKSQLDAVVPDPYTTMY